MNDLYENKVVNNEKPTTNTGLSGSVLRTSQLVWLLSILLLASSVPLQDRAGLPAWSRRPSVDGPEGTSNGEDQPSQQFLFLLLATVEAAAPKWGKPIRLFNGKDLTGWKLRQPRSSHRPTDNPSGWKVVDSALVNTQPGIDLVTEQEFEDFKLHLEFNIDPKSDSGVYLRGRYEIEIEDSFGKEPASHLMGGIYGILAPSSNASKRAGEWQSLDAILIGRTVTVILNGQTIIDNLRIPRVTADEMNSNEEAPGPILLQGEWGKISYRNIVLTPVRN
ncbi:MAG: DUF1080 domain-containing protein [Acidobacteria bacterium]|nr:DUF1080 domain-containing protein [Acidobacteriota bacterium]MCI0724696.1 DUF1080 domain-containing protein [Acidobacteriota bacterium]